MERAGDNGISEEESITIENVAGDSEALAYFESLAEGIDVQTEQIDGDLRVWGPDIYTFLAAIDPDAWSPACAGLES